MTQAAVRSAVAKHFSCPQIVPQLMDTTNRNQNASEGQDKSSQASSSKGATEKSLTLWNQSLNCDTCKMLMDAVMQPRRLKHACRLVLWRRLGHRFANCYAELPLPPALRDYVGDLTNS